MSEHFSHLERKERPIAIVSFLEKENEVYDEKAEAEKALEKKVEQIAGDANHKAVEEEEKAVVPEPNRGLPNSL